MNIWRDRYSSQGKLSEWTLYKTLWSALINKMKDTALNKMQEERTVTLKCSISFPLLPKKTVAVNTVYEKPENNLQLFNFVTRSC